MQSLLTIAKELLKCVGCLFFWAFCWKIKRLYMHVSTFCGISFERQVLFNRRLLAFIKTVSPKGEGWFGCWIQVGLWFTERKPNIFQSYLWGIMWFFRSKEVLGVLCNSIQPVRNSPTCFVEADGFTSLSLFIQWRDLQTCFCAVIK